MKLEFKKVFPVASRLYVELPVLPCIVLILVLLLNSS